MRILLVAATEAEVKGIINELTDKISNIEFRILNFDGTPHPAPRHERLDTPNLPLITHLLISGVGMVATAFAIGRHLATGQYDLVINLGIAGSFDRNIELGEVVEVTHDTLSELGAEDDAEFIAIDQLGFGEGSFEPTATLSQYGLGPLRQVNAITVNTVHGNEESINRLAKRLNVQLESMEGAAFFYACKQAGLPCLQIRAVSNYVERRNRDAWKIGLAIKNLNTFAVEILNQLQVKS